MKIIYYYFGQLILHIYKLVFLSSFFLSFFGTVFIAISSVFGGTMAIIYLLRENVWKKGFTKEDGTFVLCVFCSLK